MFAPFENMIELHCRAKKVCCEWRFVEKLVDHPRTRRSQLFVEFGAPWHQRIAHTFACGMECYMFLTLPGEVKMVRLYQVDFTPNLTSFEITGN